MLSLRRAASIDDLRTIARRRVPRFVFDFIDGAAESEAGMARNRAAFERLLLVPRYLRNVEGLDASVELFGRRWGAPLGIAPTGFCGIVWPGGDLARARAAARFNLPFVLSTVSSHSIEEVARVAPGHVWYQLHPMRDRQIADDLVRRAEAAGIEVLVVTVDVPRHGKRERDVRNGFVLPLRPTLGSVLDIARRPRWAAALMRSGPPRFANLEPYFGKGTKTLTRAAFIEAQAGGAFDWAALERLRERWPGRLVAKGLIAAQDVAGAAERGLDGIILSNHGGRQFDAAPAAMEVLPAAVDAAAGRLAVTIDGGVRRGADVVRARALGVDFVFAGRAFLYGLASGGEPGLDRSLQILLNEVDLALAQLGVRGFAELGRDAVMEAAWR